MKILKNTIMGICSVLFYYFAVYSMFLWEYNEKYAIIQDVMVFVLPGLPGVALAILLIRSSLKEFFKSWGICFASSLCMFLIWNTLNLDLMIYTRLTGYGEFGLGEGLLMAIMTFSYIIFCTIGCVIAAIISFYKNKKRAIKCMKK